MIVSWFFNSYFDIISPDYREINPKCLPVRERQNRWLSLKDMWFISLRGARFGYFYAWTEDRKRRIAMVVMWKQFNLINIICSCQNQYIHNECLYAPNPIIFSLFPCFSQSKTMVILFDNNFIEMQEEEQRYDDANTKSIKQDQLKEIILQHQSKSQKGYYTFEEWAMLHQQLLAVGKSALPVLNAWRVLKLINFGDDYVPTGLIFDCLVTLLDQERSSDQTQALIKSIFFKFIEFNGKFLSDREREELAFFKVIKSIVEGYRKLLSGSNDQNLNQQQDRNHQLYRLHNVFTYRKNLQALKKIEQEFKLCKFQPEINAKSQLVQSRYLEPKASPMKTDDRYHSNMVIDQEEEYSYGFRAQPIPAYPDVMPSGLNQHLVRMQKSREIKRINSLKPYRCGSQSEVGPFTLNAREEARREKLVGNFKILFIINAEVGKRLYRIKVRQNHTVEDVVKNIELMVGFKDDSLREIVKGYFANYENRQKIKNNGTTYA